VQHRFLARCAAYLAVGVAVCTCADDRLTTLQVGGTTYTNVNVLSHDATEIYFRHDGGLGNAPLRALMPELQQQFNFDPLIAKAVEKQRESNRTNYYPVAAFRNAALRASAERERSVFTERTNNLTTLADACSDRSLLGKPAPPLVIENLTGEKMPATKAAAKAATEAEVKFTLIFFYKSTSEPCRRAARDLNKLAKLYPAQLRLLGVTADAEADDTLALDFAHGRDPRELNAQTLGFTSLPSVLLMDAKNIVRYVGHPAALNDDAFAKLLNQ
jgi:thiol-disulfide isomerase/thioredoxin